MPAFAPKRVAAAVVSHRGQTPPFGLDTIHLSHEGLAIPQLIIVGGRDRIVGTELSYRYFRGHWLEGAPWLFATQNDAAHCCTLSAKSLILSWFNDVLKAGLKEPDDAFGRAADGSYAFFRKVPSVLIDSGGASVSQAADVTYRRANNPGEKQSAAGWLPSRETAALWQAFANLQSDSDQVSIK